MGQPNNTVNPGFSFRGTTSYPAVLKQVWFAVKVYGGVHTDVLLK